VEWYQEQHSMESMNVAGQHRGRWHSRGWRAYLAFITGALHVELTHGIIITALGGEWLLSGAAHQARGLSLRLRRLQKHSGHEQARYSR